MPNNFVLESNLADDHATVGGLIAVNSILDGLIAPVAAPPVPGKNWLYVNTATTPNTIYLWEVTAAAWSLIGTLENEVVVGTGPLKVAGAATTGSDPEIRLTYIAADDQWYLETHSVGLWNEPLPMSGVRTGNGAPLMGADSPEALYVDIDTGTVYSRTGGPLGPFTWAPIVQPLPAVEPTVIELIVNTPSQVVLTGDGQCFFTVPAKLNGFNVTGVQISTPGAVSTVSIVTVQVARVRAATPVDVLSTKATIDVGEWSSYSAAIPSVVNTANDDLLTGDFLRVDVDVADTTAAGLHVLIQVEAP